jgi:hypothetical protein
MKKILISLLFVPMICFAQFKDLKKLAESKIPKITKQNTLPDISAGLREALNNGITKQVSKLTAEDGFYKNYLVKIVLPA